jgi:UDP-glucuronate decarboxylase
MRRRRVLVLGGAGFLGSHLCERLVCQGCEVTALDNLVTGSVANIQHLRDSPAFTFIEHDVIERFYVPADRIYNLACPASPPRYQADPIRTTITSVIGTLNALELARSSGARVLLASTSEVYGDPEVHPQRESYRGAVSTTGPRACYDEGKRCAESLTMDYARQHGVGVRIARIFNTYGPRMDREDGRIISNFVVQALSGAPLTIYGDGTQTRSLCYVDDMIDGLIALMEHPSFTGPVNLGSPAELSVLEIGRLVLELIGLRGSLVHRPLPADDPRVRCPVIDLAREALGFSPRVELRDGLARTIAWFERAARDAPPTAPCEERVAFLPRRPDDAGRARTATNGEG